MAKDTREKGNQPDKDHLMKRMEFDEIISEALGAIRPGGAEQVPSVTSESEVSEPKGDVVAAVSVSGGEEKSSWHLVALIAISFVIVNVAVIGLFGADKEGVLTEAEARLERQQKFGKEVGMLDAVDTFLQNDNYLGVHDVSFTRAVEDLNQALGLIDDPDNEPFVADDFRFLDSEFVYRPRKTNDQ